MPSSTLEASPSESIPSSFVPPSSSTPETVLPSSFMPPTTSTPESEKDHQSINPQYVRKLLQKVRDRDNSIEQLTLQLNVVRDMYAASQEEVINMKKENSLLHSQISDQLQTIHKLKTENVELTEKLCIASGSKIYKTCQKLKDEAESLKKANKTLSHFQKEVERLRKDKNNLHKYLSSAKKARDRFKRKAEETDEEMIKVICSEDQFNSVTLKIGNRYTNAIRKAVISLMSECRVSVTQCSRAIQAVGNHLFGMNWSLADLPSQQTLRDIADEAHVLTKMQITEQLTTCTKFTLHCDGTSRNQRKFIGYQVSLDSGETLSLGFIDVACEDAATLLEMTIALLKELADIYDPQQADAVVKQMLWRLRSTMTDRASVMKKFTAELDKYREVSLGTDGHITFLHCNAHFLLGLSTACEGALKEFEEELKQDSPLGRDAFPKFARFRATESATSRYVRTACSILGPRGDQKSGCRVEWLAFCEESDVISRIPSYRPNRFNCFFEGAARLIQLNSVITSFLTEGYLPHSNLLIESVTYDIKDPTLMAIVVSLGILFIHFTGPYWSLLQSDTPFASFHQHVKALHQCFRDLEKDGSPLLQPDFISPLSQIFPPDQNLHDAILHFAQSRNPDITIRVVQVMIAFCRQVLERQLVDFLDDGQFSNPDPSIFNCPLTNLLGENSFDDFDFSMSKHRNASLFHHSTLQMSKANHVTDWIESKSASAKELMMQSARKKARHLRISHRQREREVMKAVRHRMLANAAAQQEKEAKNAQAKQDIIRLVMSHGGPCRFSSDVTKLERSLNRKDLLEALKTEVRYQKLVLGMPGVLRVNKSVEELSKMLKEHLEKQPSQSQPTGSDDETEMVDEETENQYVNKCFQFSIPGQWVAVFYDQDFYVGQVVTVNCEKVGTVKFLQRTKAKPDHYRWPIAEDIATVEARFIFADGFEVSPVSSNCRIWKVHGAEQLQQAYDRIRCSL